MSWWNRTGKSNREPMITAEEQEKMWSVFMDVRKSQMEWERAHLMNKVHIFDKESELNVLLGD